MVLVDNNSQLGIKLACTKQMYIGHDEKRMENQRWWWWWERSS